MDLDFNVTDLPEAHAIRNEDGTITQERRPCFNLLEDGFYGDSLFERGMQIVTYMTPNATMQPLNQAAGKAYVAWMESLPVDHRVLLTMEDFTEASHLLRNDPDVEKLSHDDYSKIVTRTALKLKAKRENGRAYIPPISNDQPMALASRSNAPPMPNARFTDPNRRGMGGLVGPDAVLHEPQRAPGPVKRAVSAPEAQKPR